MTDEEFSKMISLLAKFANTEMDQFAVWKFKSEFGDVFINISLHAHFDNSMYNDVTNAIKKYYW
ncbi:hypothetical protein N483_09115 [Pseudoalteromonas luteoviolacea NCIMB 1944]|nr:hypothetical protein N483_09115 [Pseudoalteromonas luteoviolacea NCIMB 1944]